MNTLKVVAATPVTGMATQSLLRGGEVVPTEGFTVYYRGDLRRFKQVGAVVETTVQTEVSVFSMLGKELPLGEYIEQYWQFPVRNFEEGRWYLLLLEVPVEELKISHFGIPEPEERIQSAQALQGCGWKAKIGSIRTEWIKEVQVGYVWGDGNRFMYTCTPLFTKGQLHVSDGESVRFEHQSIADVLDQSLVGYLSKWRPLHGLHEILAQQGKPDDPKWLQLARINYAIEEEPLKTELGEIKTSAFGQWEV